MRSEIAAGDKVEYQDSRAMPPDRGSMNVGIVGRIFAGCIDAVASIGLIVQLAETYSATSSLALTLWIILAFFTIPSNILVAVVFTCSAINRGVLRSEGIVAGTTLYIILVGVVNAL